MVKNITKEDAIQYTCSLGKQKSSCKLNVVGKYLDLLVNDIFIHIIIIDLWKFYIKFEYI